MLHKHAKEKYYKARNAKPFRLSGKLKNLTARGKLLAAVCMLVTAALLLITPISAYFSDRTGGDMEITLNIPHALRISNFNLDTHTGIRRDTAVADPRTGEVNHDVLTFDHFVLSDVVTLNFNLTNYGSEILTVDNGWLKLAWDTDTLPEQGYVYVYSAAAYPGAAGDNAIRTNINAGGGNALTVSSTEKTVVMNDGTARTGLELSLTTGTLAAAGSSGDSESYSYKIVYARRNSTQAHAAFLPFNGEDLKLDLKVEGSTDRYAMIRDVASAVLTAETMPMMLATAGNTSGQKFWNQPSTMDVRKNQVEGIQFVDQDMLLNPVTVGVDANGKNIAFVWDVSAAQDKTVMAWLVHTDASAARTDPILDGNGDPTGTEKIRVDSGSRYYLYVGGRNGVLANAGGAQIATFYDFNNARFINMTSAADNPLTGNPAGTPLFEVCESTNLYGLFAGTTALQGADFAGYEAWHTRNATTMQSMFEGAGTTAPGVTSLNLSKWDTTNVTTLQNMFYNANKLVNLNTAGWNLSKVTTTLQMFMNASSLVTLDATGWRFSALTNVQRMFEATRALRTVLGITGWNTSNVTSMWRMFFNSGIMNSDASANVLDLHTDGAAWDVSKVSDMSSMFDSANLMITLDTTGWKPGAALASPGVSMNSMFYSTSALRTIVGVTDWETGKVTRMDNMFYASGIVSSDTATAVLDLSGWDVSKVTTMHQMFMNANRLVTLDTTNWVPSSATDIRRMFEATRALRTIIGIGQWNTTSVSSTWRMFFNSGIMNSDASANVLDLHTDGAAWDVSKVSDMSSMFDSANLMITLDTTGWKPGATLASPGVSMNSMFYSTSALATITGIDTWDTTKVTNMSSMFYSSGIIGSDTPAAVLDLHTDLLAANGSVWDVSNVTTMANMFLSASRLIRVDTTGWVPSSLTTMDRMFEATSKLQEVIGITGWDTRKVTTMWRMFYNSNIPELDLHTDGAAWNVEKVTNMNVMFSGARLTLLHAEDWKPGAAVSPASVNMSGMFNDTSVLTTITGITDWDVSHVTSMDSMFYRSGIVSSDISTTILDLSGWDVSYVTTMNAMFLQASRLTTLDATGWAPGAAAACSLQNMFYGAGKLSTIIGITGWDVSHVTNMSGMFTAGSGINSSDLATPNVLDLDGWDVSRVSDMQNMFNGATKLITLKAAGWKPGAAAASTTLGTMFAGTTNLITVDGISTWETGKVTSMTSMFSQSGITALDLQTNGAVWDVSMVNSLSSMFVLASKLTLFNATGWNTGAVTTTSQLFYGTTSLTSAGLIGIEGWNTASVTNMYQMFYNANKLTTLDLSAWNTAAVTDMRSMFQSAGSLTDLNLSGWSLAGITANNAAGSMFSGTTQLTSVDMRAAIFDKEAAVYGNMFSGMNAGVVLTVMDTATKDYIETTINLTPRPASIVPAVP